MGSDDLDIRSGGLVAVDTDTLRAAAGHLRASAAACDAIGETLQRAQRVLERADVWLYPPAGSATDAAVRARRLAGDLDTMADTYEYAELRAQARIAETAGDDALAGELRTRMAALLQDDAGIATRLFWDELAWYGADRLALMDQYDVTIGPQLGLEALIWPLAGLIQAIGRGTVKRGAGLAPAPGSVEVRQVGGSRTSAPTSVAQLTDRIPAGDARVRVDRFTMPDGSRRFTVYIAGTSDGGEDEAWDWDSNLDMYLRRSDAASYQAVRAALADAGAETGDVVSPVGYSQGGLVATFLAMSGDYEVSLVVTAGSPVQGDFGGDTLGVALRHRDDPVAALAGGGFAQGVGAEGSITVSREIPGKLLGGDDPIEPHLIEHYRETARMLDVSSDPRVDGVRSRLEDYADATSVESFVYEASRVDPRPLAEAPKMPFRKLSGASSGGAG